MDAYTMHLLKIAVEEVEKRYDPNPDFFIYRGFPIRDEPVVVWELSNPFFNHEAPLFSDALTALLTELGVKVPERPSADQVERRAAGLDELVRESPTLTREYLKVLYAREPLTVIAMLEGEA